MERRPRAAADSLLFDAAACGEVSGGFKTGKPRYGRGLQLERRAKAGQRRAPGIEAFETRHRLARVRGVAERRAGLCEALPGGGEIGPELRRPAIVAVRLRVVAREAGGHAPLDQPARVRRNRERLL